MVTLLVAALALEGLARVVEAVDRIEAPWLAAQVNRQLPLNPYQVASDRFMRHWRLKPFFGVSAEELAGLKARSGRAEGAHLLGRDIEQGYYQPLRVNSLGFKGAAIDPEHRLPRVLAIGDSVTYGMGGWDWPQAMVARLAEAGIAVEAVNAGVEGYAIRNALIELPVYQSLRPQVCVVMLGWNDIFAQVPLPSWARNLRVLDVARRGIRMVATSIQPVDPAQSARKQRDKAKHLDQGDHMIALARQTPTKLVDNLERLGDGLSGVGCRVALATLPGLYRAGEFPSTRALEIGHLPEFTDNPQVLAEMTAAANAAIRELSARRSWQLIDLDDWSRSGLAPKEDFFTDSVHVTGAGLRRIGEAIADQLRADLGPR
ncbi:MAG: SGNH/GDSL hydrolase family protein [Alphaproteobacteria bacterium]|nr:SGNH/GDSL hydrolase family protein [Alphaproteobacteria bacterium]